ncbi:outer membrane lipoprotein-sorting protein [Maricurvus nonylphenolicus]|uniref:outer membrane lipoprotein-sorting protein n=1 Tax=Maricurvus nonylphenolicus TaxID=1008307 RepID=UPI0036F2ADFA
MKISLSLFSMVVLSFSLLSHASTTDSITPNSVTSDQLTAEEKGLAIAREWKRRDEGWGDYTANAKMVLKNKHGQESERHFKYYSMEVLEHGEKVDGDKVLVVFDRPRDVNGTALLTYAHYEEDDDQWLYLPAIKRTKRISSHNKSGSFVGSEISYEDITFPEVEKYTYRWVREEKVGDLNFDVVDRFPVDKENTGYLYQRVWYDQDHVRIFKIDFYDRKQSLLKTQTFSGFKRYLDSIWRADYENFVNHQTGKSTLLTWTNYKFHIGLTEKAFRKNSLERLR